MDFWVVLDVESKAGGTEKNGIQFTEKARDSLKICDLEIQFLDVPKVMESNPSEIDQSHALVSIHPFEIQFEFNQGTFFSSKKG